MYIRQRHYAHYHAGIINLLPWLRIKKGLRQHFANFGDLNFGGDHTLAPLRR